MCDKKFTQRTGLRDHEQLHLPENQVKQREYDRLFKITNLLFRIVEVKI